MAAATLKQEISGLSLEDKSQYGVDDGGGLVDDVISPIGAPPAPSTPHSFVDVKLTPVPGDNECVYAVDRSFHHLVKTFIRQTWPSFKVRDAYRSRIHIALPINPMSVIVNGACELRRGTEVEDLCDSVTLNLHHHYFTEGGHAKSKDFCAGNVESYNDWTDHIDAHDTEVDLPFGFTLASTSMFWLCTLPKGDSITIKVPLQRDLTKLIRMVEKDSEGNWTEVETNLSYLESGVGKDVKAELSVPVVSARYCMVSEMELARYKSCPQIRYSRLWSSFGDDITTGVPYGFTMTIPLNGLNHCLGIFVVAENQRALVYNNYNNYTTNSKDMSRGVWPIREATLMTPTNQPRLTCDPVSSMTRYKDLLISTPTVAGYVVLCANTLKPEHDILPGAKIQIGGSPCSLIVKLGLGSTSDEVKIPRSDIGTARTLLPTLSDSPTFKIFVRCLSTQTIKYEFNKATDDWKPPVIVA